MHFIQGFFCQTHSGVGIGFASGDGAVATIQEACVSVMFAGVIFHQDSDESKPLIGTMQDDFGTAVLSDITIESDHVHFLKKYLREGKVSEYDFGIEYILHPGEGNTWVGEYSVLTSRREIKGPARCIITESDRDLFLQDLKKFGLKNGFAEERSPMPNDPPPPDDGFDADRIPF